MTSAQSARSLALALGAVLLAACSSTPAASRTSQPSGSSSTPPGSPAGVGAPATPSATPAPVPAEVTTLAQRFAEQTGSGEWDGQWGELAPQAQALWPSETARTAMLSAKFSADPIGSVTLGPPVGDTTWYDPESPAVSVSHAWRFPVTVSFTDPEAVQPPGAASLFSMTSISVVDTSGTAQVVGEGPASLDAPVVLPASVTPHRVQVPLFMYHLVENQTPQRSAYGGNTYGWQIDVGLTTLTSQFQAEMAYAHSIGATSISLPHLADALLYGLPLPPHSLVITFDDGRSSQWSDAVPILRQYGFTAVFFPCTSLVGGNYGPQHYMTAAQLRDLAATGFSFGDHTLNDQTALWSASTASLTTLTEQSKSVLEALTGQPIQFIAYSGPWPKSWPQSGPGGVQEAALFRTLQSFGYLGGLQDLTFDTATDISTQLLQLPRVRVGLGVTTAGWGSFVQKAQ
ncbi:MAG TPA: polysaccharide deacetylase family protein [Candidatus Binatia bacterium]|nr:polysaccharide deacetylase family protein [Candidatus Binatia bacterium]